MSDAVFREIAELVTSELGIKMPATKKTMVESRLLRRMRALGLSDFKNYCTHLRAPEGFREEYPYFVDVVTTHKTEFFREPLHFEQLVRTVLPRLTKGDATAIKAWSAACSTGEEPYSIAMTLAAFSSSLARPIEFSVLGTDVSTLVLETARNAVYEESVTAPIPEDYKKRYLLRSRDSDKCLVRIKPSLRARVRFQQLNFMTPRWNVQEHPHIVFLRNVLIYFEPPTQSEILARIAKLMRPNGYLFLGHAESLGSQAAAFRQVGRALFQLR